MSSQVEVVSAARILARPGAEPTLRNGKIDVTNGKIVSVSQGHAVRLTQGRDLLAMPALGNGHDHGRGVKFLAFGVRDQPLEAWLPSFYARPHVDAYSNALLILARFAQSGIGSAVHCHTFPKRQEDLGDEIAAVARAAKQIGIRLGIVISMRDRNRLCYGSDASLLSLVSPPHRDEVAAKWAYTPIPAKEQVEFVEELGRRHDNELVNVQFGPIGVQWASHALLESIAERSRATGRRVHMHLLETKYQREWFDAHYPNGVIPFLDSIGLLSPRLTIAHGVWLRPAEIDLLAEREVIVSVNSSSNLRLGSGVAPARDMIARGVSVALGLDALAFDDDDDVLREMRLVHLLNRGPGFVDGITSEKLFAASLEVAPRAVTSASHHGALAEGMVADILTLDYGAMASDVIDGLIDEADLVLARGCSRYVSSLIVGGRTVLDNGVVTGVNISDLQKEVADQIGRQKQNLVEQRPIIDRYQQALREYYTSGQHTRITGDRSNCSCDASVHQ